jgi:hypothetical protein
MRAFGALPVNRKRRAHRPPWLAHASFCTTRRVIQAHEEIIVAQRFNSRCVTDSSLTLWKLASCPHAFANATMCQEIKAWRILNMMFASDERKLSHLCARPCPGASS